MARFKPSISPAGIWVWVTPNLSSVVETNFPLEMRTMDVVNDTHKLIDKKVNITPAEAPAPSP